MKHLLVLFTSLLALNGYTFASEPISSEGLEGYIYLESQQAGGISKIWAASCENCKRKAFPVTDGTVFKHLDDPLDKDSAVLHSGKGGVVIYKIDSLEAIEVVFFQ